MSEIRVTSIVGENGGDRVGLTTGLTVGPLTGTTGIGATITHQGHAQFAGVCTATSFVGSGAALTGISAGITMMDQWRITSDNNKTSGQIIDSGWERNDTYFAQIGSGMTQSSGIFTFPQTGIYLIMSQIQMNGTASYAGIKLQMSANSGSSYNTISYGLQNPDGYSALSMHAILDVTDASTHKLRMLTTNNSSTQYSGGDYNRTGLTFIRLGDT